MSLTDRELLELAAKAVGINGTWCQFPGMVERHGLDGAIYDEVECEYWNPLQDDGDALRLAADLCLNIEWFPGQKFVQACRFGIGEIIGWVDESGRSGSLRRAITVAAAKIGKALQEKH
ncbi:hypothetical protein [Pseudomonas plecoglossicida]|uniref:hypothetical protein n=1 Tax=Pseudomonas plecoglossicida TaxID=70775 RepID=UPI003D1BDB32